MGESKKRILKLLAQVVLGVVLFLFIFRYVARDWIEIKNALGTARIDYLMISLIFYIMGTLTVALAWRYLLIILGARISLIDGLRSYYWAVLGKYVPGKIWGPTARIIITGKSGVPNGYAALGLILETLLLIVSAGIVGGLALSQWQGEIPSAVKWSTVIAPLLIVVLHPKILRYLVKLAVKRLPSWIVIPEIFPSFRSLLTLMWFYCSIWVWWGAGLYMALHSLKTQSLENFVAIVAGNTLAWLIGFVAVFTPAGLGVREIILTTMVAGNAGMGVAALAAVLARLFTIIGEVLGALFTGSLRKTMNNLDRYPDEC